MRRLVATLTLTIALFGLGALPAVAGGPNNIVASDATVDATGAATEVVHSSMVVGATGTDELTSANVARAVGHDCTGCQAIAVAFQYVVSTGGPAHLSAQGNQQVAALRREVQQDLATDLTPADLNARLEDIGARFKGGRRKRHRQERLPAPRRPDARAGRRDAGRCVAVARRCVHRGDFCGHDPHKRPRWSVTAPVPSPRCSRPRARRLAPSAPAERQRQEPYGATASLSRRSMSSSRS